MSRGLTPERIDDARRAATSNRLIGMGAAQAAQDGLEPGREYWGRGWEWIATERQRRVRP